MENLRILIVDDEETIRSLIKNILKSENYGVKTTDTAESALAIIKEEYFDLIILDVNLPGDSGIDIMPDISHFAPLTPVIVITGYAIINDAVKAMKYGAFDYIKKPFKSKELLITIEKALKWKSIIDENSDLKQEISNKYNYRGIIGKSKKIKDIITTIKQVSDTDVNILITGESGTGKDLVAKALHYSGIRKEHPFVPINCSSLPDNLLESELFGYQKGAFTGAYRNKDGLFKTANNGTIFLDEIGDMPMNLQAKILKVLDSGEFIPLGSTRIIKTNARIISATNQDLKDRIENNLFREDLFYRINVVNLAISPLRERKEDIVVLIDYFLEMNAVKFKKKIKGITQNSLDTLMRYSWPGNVRELENVLESSYALNTGDIIDIKNLPDSLFKFNPNSSIDIIPINRSLKSTINHYEKKYIVELIRFCKGNVSKAAKIACIARQNMHLKLNQHKIDAREFRE